MKITTAIDVTLGICVVLLASAPTLSIYFFYFRPKAPDFQMQRIEPHAYHGMTVYVTKREETLSQIASTWAAPVGLAGFIIAIAVYKRSNEPKKTR